MNFGDWICEDPQCANVNFARRVSCNRCGRDKGVSSFKKKGSTEIGKAAAEKSKGLFSAEDWQCSKCGNVNWARRSTCNMCNAPRVGETEERTGYGGGFNERGQVEYIEREESDDEYDEFGRKKKKFRQSGAEPVRPKREEPKVVKKESEEEEEDEDEDDEDGDLSKYDLGGWGDSEDEKPKDVATNNNNSKSRSSSRSSSSSSSSRSSSSSSSSSSSRRSRSESADSQGMRDRSNRRRRRSSSQSGSRTRSPSSRSRSRSRSPRRYK